MTAKAETKSINGKFKCCALLIIKRVTLNPVNFREKSYKAKIGN